MKILSFFIFLLFFEASFSQNFSVPKKNYVRGEILFQLKKDFLKKDFENYFQKNFSKKNFDENNFLHDVAPEQNIFVFTFDDGFENEDDVLEKLRANEMVESAQFNYLVETRTITPNDSLYNRQWYLKTIKAAQAWDFGTGGVTPCGDTIVVAVLDRGFDPYIKEFAPNLWKNKNEIANNGIDDDGNGFIDDYVGYNFISGNDDHTKLLQDNDAYHGNYVTGLVGAAGNNKSGIAGVNWNIKLMILSGVTNESVIISAYSYAIKMRKLYNESGGKKGAFIAVTSMSLGLDGRRPEDHKLWCSMYDSLGQQGILNFVAATNTNGDVDAIGDLPSLCSSDYLLSINHTDSLDKFQPGGFSTKYIAFTAPGASIITTSVNNTFELIDGGNSLAAPLAAGSAALLYAVKTNGSNVCTLSKTNPSKAALIIRDALINGLDKVANLTGKSRTGGRLNLYNSVQQILTEVTQVPIETNMHVYPNPVADNFTIIFPNTVVNDMILYLYDAAGRIVKTQKINAAGLPINISVQDLTPGFYFLMCVSQVGIIYREKLVVGK